MVSSLRNHGTMFQELRYPKTGTAVQSGQDSSPIFIVLKDKQNRTMASNYASTSYKQCNVFYGRSMRKGVTIREMVGHADERTTMNSYCYDRHTEDERRAILERALSS